MDVRKEFPKRDSGRKSRMKMGAWKAKEYKGRRSAEDWPKTLGTMNGAERQGIGVTGRRKWGRSWTEDGQKGHGKEKNNVNKFKLYGFLWFIY